MDIAQESETAREEWVHPPFLCNVEGKQMYLL